MRNVWNGGRLLSGWKVLLEVMCSTLCQQVRRLSNYLYIVKIDTVECKVVVIILFILCVLYSTGAQNRDANK